MSIEQAGPSVSPKTSSTQDSRAIKGKAGDAGDTPEGGFFSLLSAVNLPVVDQVVSTMDLKTSSTQDSRAIKGKAGDAGDTPEGGFFSLLSTVNPTVELPATEPGVSRPPSVHDKELKEDVSLLMPAPPISLMDLTSPKMTRVGAGPLASESLVSGGERLSALSSAAADLVKVNSTSGLQAVAATNPLADDAPAGLMLAAGNWVQSEGSQGLDPRAQNLLRVRPSQGDEIQSNQTNIQSVPAALMLGEGNVVQSNIATGVDPRTQKLLQARRTLGDELRVDATHVRLESRAVQAASELDVGGKESMLAKLPLTGDFAARLLEPIERTRGKLFGSVGVSGAEGGWTQYSHHARPVGDLPSNLSAMVTTQMQTQVADKVSYWVTQGIQNAELKLDGFGNEPVEVSILLKGGEAHVGFRSDQPEVRQMLESALSQLKESLEREGVLLSGVTVGGSGANGSGRQQEERQGFSANRGGADGVSTAPETRILRASTSVGRSLDIFV